MPTYLNGIKFIKEGKFGIKFMINIDELVKETATLKDSKGNIKSEFVKRKEVGKWGETHSCKIDDWKPDQQPQEKQSTNIAAKDLKDDFQDLPF